MVYLSIHYTMVERLDRRKLGLVYSGRVKKIGSVLIEIDQRTERKTQCAVSDKDH